MNDSRATLLRIISISPGIRYNDLVRITSYNHGVLSYSLDVLEKKDLIKCFRVSKGRMTRYYSSSISDDYLQIISYLKNKTTREIILLLYRDGEKTFTEIRNHIGKASSTTSWNIKRLYDDNIIKRAISKRGPTFLLVQPLLLSNIMCRFNNLTTDRTVNVESYVHIM